MQQLYDKNSIVTFHSSLKEFLIFVDVVLIIFGRTGVPPNYSRIPPNIIVKLR